MAIRFEITSSLLPDHASVAAFHGSEGISRPYVFDVYVVVDGGTDVDIDEAPGAKVTLTIDGGDAPAVHYSGIIATMELLRSVNIDGQAAHENSLYLVRIVPHLWQLSLTKHSRIWTKTSIPDIIKDVLEEEGVSDVELRLQSSYEPEEHVCQYKESSLNFIQRWMEREGMYYFFEQDGSSEKLIITDNKSTSTISRVNPIPYYTGGSKDGMAGAHLDMFTWRNSATPATVKFTDYDYGKPALGVNGKASVSKLGIGEQVTYGNRFFTPSQGDSLATIRAEDLRAQAKTFHGSGPVIGITSGYQFIIEGHPKLQLNVEYLAVTVEHFGYLHGRSSAWGKAIPSDHTDTYRVDLTAIVATQQYRHPETAVWPRLDGFENAVVDGPATSEYAQIDDHGRYNLKFKFDEGTLKGGKASTWVRKMQPHAGTVEGWHFPERAGTEVVCAFLGGDPDRPIIVGAVPTAIHPSPVNKSNHTKNVIQTGGKNRFEMEDQAGQERVTISTPHQKSFIHIGSALAGLSTVYSGDGDGEGPHINNQPIEDHQVAIVTEANTLMSTGGDHDLFAGGKWRVQVKGNHVEDVFGDRVHWVKGKLDQEVRGKLMQEVQQDVTEAYHAKLDQGVQGAVTLTHKSTFTHLVSQAVKEEFGASAETKVTGDWKVEIGANKHFTVAGAWNQHIEGAKCENVMGAVQNSFLGLKSEFVGGVKLDEVGGARIDTTIGVKGEICMAVHFEVAPSKLNAILDKTGLHLESTKIAAEKTEAAAAEQKLKGMEDDIAGLKKADAAIIQGSTALAIKTEALESRVHTLTNTVSGLHSKM